MTEDIVYMRSSACLDNILQRFVDSADFLTARSSLNTLSPRQPDELESESSSNPPPLEGVTSSIRNEKDDNQGRPTNRGQISDLSSVQEKKVLKGLEDEKIDVNVRDTMTTTKESLPASAPSSKSSRKKKRKKSGNAEKESIKSDLKSLDVNSPKGNADVMNSKGEQQCHTAVYNGCGENDNVKVGKGNTAIGDHKNSLAKLAEHTSTADEEKPSTSEWSGMYKFVVSYFC